MTKREFRAEDVAGLSVVERVKPEDMEAWAKTHEKFKPNVVFIHEGRIVIAGGFGIIYPGVAESWIHIADGCPGRALVEVKRQFYAWIEEYHLWRVQALVLSAWAEGNRFLEWLGMQHEGTLRKMSPDGRDENLWAVIHG